MRKLILIVLICAGCTKDAVKPTPKAKKVMDVKECKSCVCNRSLCPVGTAD